MDAFGIEKKEIESVIKKGTKWKERKDIWHARMTGLEVVFQKLDNAFIVITVYKASP